MPICSVPIIKSVPNILPAHFFDLDRQLVADLLHAGVCPGHGRTHPWPGCRSEWCGAGGSEGDATNEATGVSAEADDERAMATTSWSQSRRLLTPFNMN